MHIKNLLLKNFRNYKNEKVSFHKKVNIIIGNNAQGKTNLLEALYMMSIGKSFRTNRDQDMIMFNEKNAYFKVWCIKENSEITIDIFLDKNQKKAIKINDIKLRKNTDILENLYIVVFSPEDLKIVKDGPEKRRNFINRELCLIKPLYYHNLYKYSKIILQRNAFLKEHKYENYDKNMLEIWDNELSKYGIKIIKDRMNFIKKLNIISKEIHKNITNGKERIELIYETNVLENEDINNLEFEKIYLSKIKNHRKKDFFRGNTNIGPHKDDIRIMVNDKDIRHFGSQGQQRTASLSLKLAEIKLIKEETGEIPILLLDDVLSELDYLRQKYLISSLKDVQLFITATEINALLKDNLTDHYIFRVFDGKIIKEK